VGSPGDGPVGPRRVEIRRCMNGVGIVTSVGFSFHITELSTSLFWHVTQNRLMDTDISRTAWRLKIGLIDVQKHGSTNTDSTVLFVRVM